VIRSTADSFFSYELGDDISLMIDEDGMDLLVHPVYGRGVLEGIESR